MRVIREILLTEYIGAIVVAVLVTDAAAAIITTAVAQISYYLQFGHNAIADSHRLSTPYTTLGALSRVALYLGSAYLLARWLYPRNPVRAAAEEAEKA
jgi:hypothetical protein